MANVSSSNGLEVYNALIIPPSDNIRGGGQYDSKYTIQDAVEHLVKSEETNDHTVNLCQFYADSRKSSNTTLR